MATLREMTLNNPAIHNWTKKIINEAMERDIVDAYYDLKCALDVVDDELERLGLKAAMEEEERS